MTVRKFDFSDVNCFSFTQKNQLSGWILFRLVLLLKSKSIDETKVQKNWTVFSLQRVSWIYTNEVR